MLDAQRAIRLVRSHASDWKINPAKVGIMGFSAGGHLASTVDTHFDVGNPSASDPTDRLNCRPDFAVLVYPVISMKDGVTDQGTKQHLLGPNPDPALVQSLSNDTQVTPQTPPTILVHAVDDRTVPIENSRLMYAALQKAGVPSALQEYPHGGHGFGFGPNQKNAPPGWLDNAYNWLKGQGFVP
jgi:acetyl esterase/lipase